jgi:hypothetical protein
MIQLRTQTVNDKANYATALANGQPSALLIVINIVSMSTRRLA